MAERGRLDCSGGPRSSSGECSPAERGTVPRDGVRRPPGGALPSRLRRSNGAPSRAPPLCGRRAAAPGFVAYVASGAIGAHARTLCSESTAEVMCTERGEVSCCCCCGDTARCAASRAALSALSAAASPVGEESRSDRSSAGVKGGSNSVVAHSSGSARQVTRGARCGESEARARVAGCGALYLDCTSGHGPVVDDRGNSHHASLDVSGAGRPQLLSPRLAALEGVLVPTRHRVWVDRGQRSVRRRCERRAGGGGARYGA